MVKRFTESAPIGVQNLGTGAVSGLMALGDKFANFSSQQLQKAEQQITEQSTEQGRDSFVKGEKPEFQEERFIGGVRSRAFNKGLKNSYLSSISNDLRQDLAGAERENPDNTGEFDTKISGLRAALDAQIDPSVKTSVLQGFDSQATMARIRIQDKQARRIRSEQVSNANGELSTISSGAQTHGREGDLRNSAVDVLSFNQRVDAAVEAEIFDEATANSMKSSNSQAVQEQIFFGDIERSAEEDGFALAFQAVEELPATPPNDDFTQKEWDTFKAQAVTALTKKQTLSIKAEAGQSIDLSREISDIQVQARTGTGNPEAIVKRTEELFETGDITEQERTSIRTNLINKDKADRKQAIDFSAVAKRLAGDDAIVLDDKSVNKFYSDVIAPSLEGKSPIEQDIQKAHFVDRMKRVPSSLKAEVNTFLQSENRDLIVRGSQMIDRFDNTPGLSEREFSSNERAFADQVVSLSANMSPEEAVLLARKLTDPNDQARIEAVAKGLEEDKKGFNAVDYREVVDDHFDPIFGSTNVGGISGDQLSKEYGDQYEALVKSGMSKDAANEKSLQLIGRNWAVSDVTGRAMKYPPDQYYQVNGSVDYIRPQLAREINEKGAFPDEIPVDNIFLQATEDTARSATGGKPAYRVVILDDDGSITPFFGGLWFPSQKEELDRIEVENKALLKKRESIQEPFSRKGAGGVKKKTDSEQETLTDTGKKTKEGRPVLKNRFGDFVTERTITEEVPELGGFVNVPTVFDGGFVSDSEAIKKIIKAGGKDPVTGRKLKVFSSLDSAIKSAEKRSNETLSDELRGL